MVAKGLESRVNCQVTAIDKEFDVRNRFDARRLFKVKTECPNYARATLLTNLSVENRPERNNYVCPILRFSSRGINRTAAGYGGNLYNSRLSDYLGNYWLFQRRVAYFYERRKLARRYNLINIYAPVTCLVRAKDPANLFPYHHLPTREFSLILTPCFTLQEATRTRESEGEREREKGEKHPRNGVTSTETTSIDKFGTRL